MLADDAGIDLKGFGKLLLSRRCSEQVNEDPVPVWIRYRLEERDIRWRS
jgi:hypothetical protein